MTRALRNLGLAAGSVLILVATASAQNSMFPSGAMPNGMSLSQLMSQFGGTSGLGGLGGGLGGLSGGLGGMSGGLGGMSSSLGGSSLSSSSFGGLSGGMSGGLGTGGVSGNNFGGVRAGSNFGANSGVGGGFGAQGQGGFVGRSANQYVGMNAMTGANLQGGINAGGQNFLGGNRAGGLNLNNLQGFNQNGMPLQQVVPIRAQQRIAFDYPKITPPAIENQVHARFHKLTANSPAMRGVSFSAAEAGEVVLRGEVKSASAAKLAERLVRLEPGVKSVRNELTFPAE